jgi:hypothetical protein
LLIRDWEQISLEKFSLLCGIIEILNENYILPGLVKWVGKKKPTHPRVFWVDFNGFYWFFWAVFKNLKYAKTCEKPSYLF